MRILILIILAALMSACKAFYMKQPEVSDNFHGYYKVGNPYQIEGKWYYPKEDESYDEMGVASWYGPEFHGKRTANGDHFDQHALTAAHKTLPLPSMVKVTNLENNKTLILMVNDRGPFSKGRIIDVSKRAAQILDFEKQGTAKVRVQFLPGQTKKLLANLPADKEGITKDESQMVTMEEKPNMIMQEPKSLSQIQQDMHFEKELDNMNLNHEKYSKVNNLNKESENKNQPIDLKQHSQNSNNDIKEMDIPSLNLGKIKREAFNVKKDDDNLYQIVKNKNQEYNIPAKNEVFIQAGTYAYKKNAYMAEKNLSMLGNVKIENINIAGKRLYRVKLGPIQNPKITKIVLDKVINLGHLDALIVTEKNFAKEVVESN